MLFWEVESAVLGGKKAFCTFCTLHFSGQFSGTGGWIFRKIFGDLGENLRKRGDNREVIVYYIYQPLSKKREARKTPQIVQSAKSANLPWKAKMYHFNEFCQFRYIFRLIYKNRRTFALEATKKAMPVWRLRDDLLLRSSCSMSPPRPLQAFSKSPPSAAAGEESLRTPREPEKPLGSAEKTN